MAVFMILIACCWQCSSNPPAPEERSKVMIADSCNNPDAHVECCFLSAPARLISVMQICSKAEPGEPLTIKGKILKNGQPFPGVVMYAYQTDHTGIYSKSGNEEGIQKWQGRLHGWCRTNDSGNYEIRTIRPAPYPDASEPAHIHAALKVPGQPAFYINDFLFEDDPALGLKQLKNGKAAGAAGIVKLSRDSLGNWRGTRNIILDQP